MAAIPRNEQIRSFASNYIKVARHKRSFWRSGFLGRSLIRQSVNKLKSRV